MSAERDEGGRAFPWCGDLNECPTINLGMTLRDHFAGLAMQGASANPMILDWFNKYGQPGTRLCDWLAVGAYEMADKMLEERAK